MGGFPRHARLNLLHYAKFGGPSPVLRLLGTSSEQIAAVSFRSRPLPRQ
jgi:hypothetical protein